MAKPRAGCRSEDEDVELFKRQPAGPGCQVNDGQQSGQHDQPCMVEAQTDDEGGDAAGDNYGWRKRVVHGQEESGGQQCKREE